MTKGVTYEYRAKDKTQAANRSVNAGLAGLNRSALGLRSTLAGLGVGILGRQVVGQIAGYERAMSGVKAVTRASAEEMKAMKATARNLGATTAFSAQEAASGMEFLGRAGFNTAAILESIPGVLDLAAAGAIDLGRAADISSNILTAFRLEANEMGRVVDVMTAATASANTDIEQLGEALKFAAPFAAEFGISIEETAAAVGVLSDAGLQGTLAGTGLKRLLADLKAPSDELRLAMGGLNLEANTLTEVMEEVAGSSLTSSQAIEIFGKIAAPAFFNIKAGTEKLGGLSKAFLDVSGTSGRQAQIRMDNLWGAGKQLTSALSELTLVAGDAGLSSGLRDMAESITEVSRGGEAALVVQEIGTAFKYLVDHKEEIGAIAASMFALKAATALTPGAFSKKFRVLIPIIAAATAGLTTFLATDAEGASGTDEIDEKIGQLIKLERKIKEFEGVSFDNLKNKGPLTSQQDLDDLLAVTKQVAKEIRAELSGLGVSTVFAEANKNESAIKSIKKSATAEDQKALKLFRDRVKKLDEENGLLNIRATHQKQNVELETEIFKLRQKMSRDLLPDEFEALRKTLGAKSFILSELKNAERTKEFGEVTRGLAQENALLEAQVNHHGDALPLIRARFELENKFGPLRSDEERQLGLLFEKQRKLNNQLKFQNDLVQSADGIFDRFGDGVVENMQRGTGAMEAFSAAATAALFDVQRELVKLLVFNPLKEAAIGGFRSLFPAITTSGGSASPDFGGTALNPQNTGLNFATAGGFDVGGSGGPDSQRFNLNLSPGEAVRVFKGEPPGGSPTQVVINNFSGQPATTRTTRNSQGGKTIEVMIGEVVAGDIKNNGPIAGAIEGRFAVSDNLVSR